MTPTLLILCENHRATALSAATSRNEPSKSEPNTWYSGRVAKRLITPMSACVSGRAGGGGKDVRSWMSVVRR